MKLETLLYYRDLNVEKIEVRYSGGGDSGAIDEFIYYNKNEKIVKAELKKDLEDFCYKITNNIEDWWNNDGGHGTIFINLLDNTFTIENNIEYREYETFNHKGEIITD